MFARSSSATTARADEVGATLVALIAAITVMLILMGAAVPTWRYVMKDAREEELIFRGTQIAQALQRYQAKNGNALPTSLDVLVKGKFLRKAYTDPMSRDGKWRFIHPGEPLPGGVNPLAPPGPGRPGTAPSTPPSAAPMTHVSPGLGSTSLSSLSGVSIGPILGVASRSTEDSLRLVNGRSRYSEWFFLAGQTPVIGRMTAAPRLPGVSSPAAGVPAPLGPTR